MPGITGHRKLGEAHGTIKEVALRKVVALSLILLIGLSMAGFAVDKDKIGVVLDVGGKGDLSFNDMAILGAQKAAAKYGMEYTILQSASEDDYLPNLRSLADDGSYVIIVGVGFLLGNAMDTVTQEYPDQNFAIIDFPNLTGAPNLMGLVFNENEMSALVGALSGMIALHFGYDTIGLVLGMEIPVLYHFEGGYRFGIDYGVSYYNDKMGTSGSVSLVYSYTGYFDRPDVGYATGKTQLEQGAVSIFNVAGQLGIGMEEAVTEYHNNAGTKLGPPFFLGVDANQDYLGLGAHALASGLKRVDVAVDKAITDTLEGTFEGQTFVFNLENGGVGISRAADLLDFIPIGIAGGKATNADYYTIIENWASNRANVPYWIWQAVDQLEADIIAGDVVVPYANTLDDMLQVRADYPLD